MEAIRSGNSGVPLAERAGSGLHLHMEQLLVREFPDRSLGIVDVGCGTGAFLQRLSDHGYQNLQGVDIRPAVAQVGAARMHAVDVDAGVLPLQSASCDIAVLIEFMEHVENPGMLLSELHRIVRPGGCVLLTTPSLHSLEARFRWLLAERLKQFDEIGDPTHIYPIFLHPFRRLCQRHGFHVRRHWGHPENGESPTSRAALRFVSRVLGTLGLRSNAPGDHLCLMLDRVVEPESGDGSSKPYALTRHYGTEERTS